MFVRASRSILLVLVVLFGASTAFAFPWDNDLNKQDSFKPNEMVRAPVKGTVPVGHKPFTLTPDEASSQLKNPVGFDRDSVWRGQRLWNVNCHTCHGAGGKGDGPVGPQVAVPDILQDFYKQKKDGRFFAVIHHGQGGMPRYGYKFSTAEKWDLVNYVRFLQGRDVDGISRPE